MLRGTRRAEGVLRGIRVMKAAQGAHRTRLTEEHVARRSASRPAAATTTHVRSCALVPRCYRPMTW